MPSSPIRTAVFDIGMVLLRFDFNLAVSKIDPHCAVTADRIAPLFWEGGLMEAYERGKIGTSQFAEEAGARVGFRGTPRELIHAWSDIFTPNDPMVKRTERWKNRGLPLYLLSNTCESHIEFFTSTYEVFTHFNGAVFSCREGFLKPERALYEILIQRHHLDPCATVFVDDRLENVEAARELGFHAFRYTNETELVKSLKLLGLD